MSLTLPMLTTLWSTVVVEMQQRQNGWTSTQLVTMESDSSWSRSLAAAKPFQQQFGSPDTTGSRLVVVSYNLHGLNQGCAGVREMINVLNPDVIMTQEHWPFPSNMYRLNDISCEYFAFGSSSMDSAVGASSFYGRPYGGVAILMKKKLMPFTVNVFTADRLIAVKIADRLLINCICLVLVLIIDNCSMLIYWLNYRCVIFTW